MANLQVLQPGMNKKRHRRSPNFPIAGIMKPYGAYPIFVHPVLPGETLQEWDMKWRCLSKPIKHPLVGAWMDTWLIYVKFTDIDRALGEMFISDTYSTAGWTAGSNRPRHFTKSGQIDWVYLALNRIANAFFLHEGETIIRNDEVPMLKMANTSWYQNLMFKPAGVDPAALPSNPDAQLTGYQMMQMMNMTEVTYESYLKQYGVQSIVSGVGQPEILRYTRSWTVPVNTVEPSTGIPSSAWVWSDHLKLDKAKRFDEPGFVMLVASSRPKMYQADLPYSFVGNLWGFSDWFPAYNLADPAAGVRLIVSSDAVIDPTAVTGGPFDLLYDHRDLLNHGEQFVNATDATMPYALPRANGLAIAAGATQSTLQGEYPLAADIDALFVGAGASDKFLYYEGMSSLVIDGHMTDTTVAR